MPSGPAKSTRSHPPAGASIKWAKRFSLIRAPPSRRLHLEEGVGPQLALGLRKVGELLAALEIADADDDVLVSLGQLCERLVLAAVRHRVAVPGDVLSGVLRVEHEVDEQERGARMLRVHR